jgi:hypothetical protein
MERTASYVRQHAFIGSGRGAGFEVLYLLSRQRKAGIGDKPF